MFIPYFFQSNESKNRALKIIDSIQESDDIEYIIVTVINDPVLSPSTVDLLDREEARESEDFGEDSNILQRPKLFSIEEIKSTPEDPKDFSTYLIEELNSCIG